MQISIPVWTLFFSKTADVIKSDQKGRNRTKRYMENDIYHYLLTVALIFQWLLNFWETTFLCYLMWFIVIHFSQAKTSKGSPWDSFVAKVIKGRKSVQSIIAATIVNTKWINQVLAD